MEKASVPEAALAPSPGIWVREVCISVVALTWRGRMDSCQRFLAGGSCPWHAHSGQETSHAGREFPLTWQPAVPSLLSLDLQPGNFIAWEESPSPMDWREWYCPCVWCCLQSDGHPQHLACDDLERNNRCWGKSVAFSFSPEENQKCSSCVEVQSSKYNSPQRSGSSHFLLSHSCWEMEGLLWGHSTGLGAQSRSGRALGWCCCRGFTTACSTDVLKTTAALEMVQGASDKKAALFLAPHF